jgi:hypothetical protein
MTINNLCKYLTISCVPGCTTFILVYLRWAMTIIVLLTPQRSYHYKQGHKNTDKRKHGRYPLRSVVGRLINAVADIGKEAYDRYHLEACGRIF